MARKRVAPLLATVYASAMKALLEKDRESELLLSRQGGESGHKTPGKPKMSLRLDAREAAAIKREAREVYECSMGLFVANLWRNYKLSGKRLEMLPPEWARR